MAQGLLKFIVGLAVVASVALATSSVLAQWDGTPTAPQPASQHPEFAKFVIDHIESDINAPEAIQAQHGPACEGPPATHLVTRYEDSVYVCSNHVMTAINQSGYGEIKLTPNRVLDFSQGAVVQWNMSTEVMSGRDWVSFFITPFDKTTAYDDDRPDPNIGPQTGIQVRQAGGWHLFRWDNFVKTQIGGGFAPGSNDGIITGTNTAAVRQTFRLTISTTHARMERLASATAPVPLVFFDVDIPGGLPFSSGVVTWGHHSYNPTKANCPACLPATWHWDEFQLTPSTEFTLIKADRRYVCEGGGGNHPGCPDPQNKIVTFAQPAPVGAFVRYSSGHLHEISLNNGATWIVPRRTDNAVSGVQFPHTIFQLIPAGTTKMMIRFTDFCGPLMCTAQDFTIWSLQGGGTPSTPAPPVSTQTPISTPTPVAPTPTPISTPTPVAPTPTPIIVPTSTPPPPASTSSPQPTASPAPPPITPPASATAGPAVLCYRSTDNGATIVKVSC